MKPVTWIRFFLLCVIIGQFRAVEARNVHFTPQEKTDTLINPPLIEGVGHILRSNETVLNIGTLIEDDTPKMYRFTCTDISGEAINLTRVRATCGRVVADVHTGEMSPGETRVVVLTYRPKNHPRTIGTNAFIYLSSSGRMPVAHLTLVGSVLPGADEWGRYPYKMGELRLKQNRIGLREIDAGERPSKRIPCGNSENQSLRLSAAVIPEFATFRTRPEVISPGSGADVVIAIDASLIPVGKGCSFTFPIVIGGVEGQPSDQILNIKVNCIE